MRFNSVLHQIVVLLFVFFQGCATYQIYRQVAEFERPPEYVNFFKLLDQKVKEADVRDASGFPVRGFPYLRTNRFVTSLKHDLSNDAQRAQWVRWMQQLDLQSRRKEIRNLPDKDLEDLTREVGISVDRDVLYKRTADYSENLMAHDWMQPGSFESLQAAVTNPSEYSTAMRVVGIYPLTSIPVASVTRRLQGQFEKWHQSPADQLETLGELTAYGPARRVQYSREAVHLILNRSRRNAFGVPLPAETDRQMLLAMFAPVIYQDVAADYDKIGKVVWLEKKVSVSSVRPTVYYYFSNARLKGAPILQLNYVFWYTARNGPKSPRIERGSLDGVTVRISLDNDGQPFMVDIMNNCGCYHFFVPNQERIKKTIPIPDGLDAFAPRWLPESYPQKPLGLRILSGWHQVAHLNTDMMASASLSYELLPYDRLESLPHDDNTFESIFNSRGIAKNSERIEPLIFFPMGIADIGSMRQRGHHAVKLVGREIFDDPYIFDNNFE